ncbi:MAG: hypothetical protein RLY78_3227 [Pseudomonadota bacterium]|jgi:hypothetical protein
MPATGTGFKEKPMYEQLVYVSRASPGVGPRDCHDIIRTAHNRNRLLGLTGGLLLLDGFFVQVLEGDRRRVRQRFEVIARDPRHAAIQLRGQRHSDRLQFAGEWMALRHRDELPPGLLEQLGYRPGLPSVAFDADRLVAFVQTCCTAPLTTA